MKDRAMATIVRASSRGLGISLLAVGVMLVTCRSAYAYVDPGTGGMILQLLLGGVAGAAVILKLYWEKISGLFKRHPQAVKRGQQHATDTTKSQDSSDS